MLGLHAKIMVEDFGSYLKHERELRGVPLEEISGATKIHIRFLKALEENSFDELPGEVFIKGYIRSYANTIGSDVEEMLNIYKESVELKNQENLPAEEPSSKGSQKNYLSFGLMALGFLGLLFGVGFLVTKGDDPKEIKISPDQKKVEEIKPEPSVQPEISKEMTSEETLDAKDEASTQSKTDKKPESLAVQQVPQEDSLQTKLTEQSEKKVNDSQSDLGLQGSRDIEKPLKLIISTKENSWFNMTIDDFREEDFILTAGSAKTFWANDAFRLTVGNKSGVELSLNGKDITLPESNNKVIKDFIINSEPVE